MKSIAIIFPYFGTLPVQYKMWRASALENRTVDFRSLNLMLPNMIGGMKESNGK